jgi:REP element-mobilizing transposase RayT
MSKTYNPLYHHRKSIRLREYDYTNPNWYYVTICTHDKKKIFGEVENGKMILNKFGKIVEEEWIKTKEIRKNVDLDYYVVMPNHFHGIIINGANNNDVVGAIRWIAPTKERITLPSGSLGAIIGQFKSKVTKRIRFEGIPEFKWQRNYYEHIIRNDHDLYNIRTYIQNNPLKWELDEYYSK